MLNQGQNACLSAERCAGKTPDGPYPTSDPLCLACLDKAERNVRNLVYDFLDLAQLHEQSMSQAITEKTGGSKDSPMLLSGHVEALQAEIVHVTLTWEAELRVACRLSDPETLVPLADWHTTISKPQAVAKVRPGAALQRAVHIIAPRLERLSKLPTTAVCPTGVEDDFRDTEGWEAVQQLQALHQRARATLGRTRRTFWIPGECWACDARPKAGQDGPLYRSEPREYDDPMQVGCSKCSAQRPYSDFEHYMANLLWPDVETDGNVRIAA